MNKKVKTSLLIAGIGAFALSAAVTIGAKAESDILRGRVNDCCNEVRSVQAYIEAKKDYEKTEITMVSVLVLLLLGWVVDGVV